MKFNWQEIAEQHAARIRELEEYVSELQYALDLATGNTGDSNLHYELWKTWIHEKDCPGYDNHDDPCRCDGIYIIQVVEDTLNKRV